LIRFILPFISGVLGVMWYYYLNKCIVDRVDYGPIGIAMFGSSRVKIGDMRQMVAGGPIRAGDMVALNAEGALVSAWPSPYGKKSLEITQNSEEELDDS